MAFLTSPDLISLFEKEYGKKKLVLDINLLILLMVGFFDSTYIPQCRITERFTEQDYQLLLSICQHFESEIIITPHIMAELSNLSRSKRGISDDRLRMYFNVAVDKLNQYKEEHIPFGEIAAIDLGIIVNFGFTDMTIVEAAKKLGAVILTDDLPLAEHAVSCGMVAINFTNIKTYNFAQ